METPSNQESIYKLEEQISLLKQFPEHNRIVS